MDTVAQFLFLKRLKVPFIRKARAVLMRSVFPRRRYIASLSVRPISVKHGFDRGLPVDRFYIERFLKDNKQHIRGACLEVVDNTYTMKFGEDRVTKSDAIDIFKTRVATIHGDLRNLSGLIPDNTYDTVILTQTLHVIDEYEQAIKECHRILKPGGNILVTVPTISPAWHLSVNMWRFSPRSAQYVFAKHFDFSKIKVIPLGNGISTEMFWLGMAVEDMTTEELQKDDLGYPTIIGIVATK